jgi:holo-[acyl-carrier protein] synthase
MSRDFRWTEIEILSDQRGKPLVHLHGSVQKQAVSLRLESLAISLSDCEEYAVAFAVGEGK